MSRQATKINISEEQRTALENGYRNGSTHSFRMRCLMVLGKADGLSNAAAGVRVGQTYQQVMHWVRRFQSDGIAGQRNKPGNGRMRIISTKKDKEAVREAIRKHR
ncbi:MAG: helix-turn-helix domain-containing protein [Paramuribaculum sp.]|nr:helix-turn-helix domain-containing protein [Paramuribaculum sp.]